MQRPEENPSQSKAHFVVKLAFLLHLLAFILSFIAFFSPFWHIELNTGITIGLWGRCDENENNCIWFHERDYAWEHSLPPWHIAAQVLFAIGIGTLFISCWVAVGNLMFRCCNLFALGTCPILFGILIAIAMTFETISIAVYGIGAYQVYECSIHSWVAHFEWAFYVGIAALFNCLIAAVAYIFAGYSILEDMKGYEEGPYGFGGTI